MGLFTNSIILDLFSIVIALSCAIYAYFIYSFNYWSRRGVFNPPPEFPFGNLKEAILDKQSHAGFSRELYVKLRLKGLHFGGYYSFLSPELLVINPDLIRAMMTVDFKYFCNRSVEIDIENEPLSDNLFAQKGQKWKKMRQKLTPTFTSGKIKMMFPIFVDCAERLKKILDGYVHNQEDFDAISLLERFSADVIGSCALGLECDSLNDAHAELLCIMKKTCSTTKLNTIKRIMIRYAYKLFNFFKMKYVEDEVSEFFEKIVTDMIEYREENNITRNDFLQLLINMKNSKNMDNEVVLNLQEIVAQCFLFFIAGLETSSSSTSFFFYEMCLHPDIQDKVREEINNMLDRCDGKLTYNGVNELQYLEMALFESMRLHTAAPIFERRCTQDYKIPNSDVIIEKGTRIIIPVNGLHSDPEYYPEPNKYDPERFSRDEKNKIHPFTFMPFGEGPRVCIGKRFGLLQDKVAIISLMRNHRLTLSKKMQVPLRISSKSTMVTKVEGGIWIRAERV